MSYIPTEWQTGDIVTADKLNKLEEGVASGGGGGGGAIKMTMTPVEGTNSFTLDKTYADISAALQGGSLCYTIHYQHDGEEGSYGVLFAVFYGESEDSETEETIYYVTVSDVRGYTQIFFNSSTVDGTLIGSIQG